MPERERSGCWTLASAETVPAARMSAVPPTSRWPLPPTPALAVTLTVALAVLTLAPIRLASTPPLGWEVLALALAVYSLLTLRVPACTMPLQLVSSALKDAAASARTIMTPTPMTERLVP